MDWQNLRVAKSKMKRVLFIDYFFPPLAADYRGTAFVKLLPEFKWEPIVISADERVSYDKDYSLLQEIPNNIEIHRVGHREPSKFWQYIRNKLMIAADFPDYYKSWFRPACRVAKEILKNGRIDLVYSASPTFVTAFVAMELKNSFSVPWIADFLDGWAVNDFLILQYNQTLIKPLRWVQTLRIQRAERKILERADKVVVIHEHVKRRWVEFYGVRESKIEVITDGYDEAVFEGLTPRRLNADHLTVTFLGSYYSPFEDEIRKFVNVVYEIDRKAEVVFIGRAAAAVQAMKMPNVVCIHQLPRKKALSFALGSDFLFLVMPSYAKWTPTKTYDYLRIGKPVLALVPEDGDAARIIGEAGGGFILSYDHDQMRQQLQEIFNMWRKGELGSFRPNRKYIGQFERRNLTDQIVRVFNQVSS